MTLKEKILAAGIENCLFLVPMRPVQTVFGLISYTSSSDKETIVPATIDENRYKISENYKITLKSKYPNFGKEHFYISDLALMIERGTIEMFVKP